MSARGLALSIALTLAGCSGGTMTGLLPQATESLQSDSGIAQPADTEARIDATVAVASISGPPQAVWDRLIRQLDAASREANIALLNYQGATADYRLQGYVITTPTKSSITVSYIWDLFDKSGSRVSRTAGSQKVDHTGKGDPWSAMPDPVLKLIADQAVLAVRTRSTQPTTARTQKPIQTPMPDITPKSEPSKPEPSESKKVRREDALLLHPTSSVMR